jgi:endogenous inhibitor of DNA gyrase (YacG/DUF329 family)
MICPQCGKESFHDSNDEEGRPVLVIVDQVVDPEDPERECPFCGLRMAASKWEESWADQKGIGI